MAQGNDSLSEYNAKRDFSSTPEPKGAHKKGKGALFVIQKHDLAKKFISYNTFSNFLTDSSML